MNSLIKATTSFSNSLSIFLVRQNQFDQMCNSERGWAFERMIGSSIDGFDHKTIEGIDNRGECGRLCLLESEFDCRSAEYDFESKKCILSREDRRTQPEAFRTNTPGIDYIENQCAKGIGFQTFVSYFHFFVSFFRLSIIFM